MFSVTSVAELASDSQTLDLLAIGAHPDDAELLCGGTLALLARRGFSVALADLTRGECGTRGTAETRGREAADAARILGVRERVQLDLGDGRLESSDANRRALAGLIRKLRPRVVLAHHPEGRHPDHFAARDLARDACFLANVGGYAAEGARHEVEEIAYFIGFEWRETSRADWIADVGPAHETKLAALRAYPTQFYSPGAAAAAPPTLLASEQFWKQIDARSRYWGGLIGAEHGEAFVFARPPHAGHALVKMFSARAEA